MTRHLWLGDTRDGRPERLHFLCTAALDAATLTPDVDGYLVATRRIRDVTCEGCLLVLGRDDHPGVGLFRGATDAILEADRRAALTRRRYRVRLEPNNHWWQITETVDRIAP